MMADYQIFFKPDGAGKARSETIKAERCLQENGLMLFYAVNSEGVYGIVRAFPCIQVMNMVCGDG